MNNNNINNNNNGIKSTTNKEIELKMLRERINKGKGKESNVKTPRRYNPVNNNIDDNQLINNSNNQIDNNSSNKDINSFNNKNLDSFNNKNDQAFENKNNLGKEINDIDNNDINNNEGDSVNNSNQELLEENNINDDFTSNNMPIQNNNNSIKRNNNNYQNNIAKDPTQRKLDRLNSQKKQQASSLQDDSKQENKNTNLNKDKQNNEPTTNQSKNTPKTNGSVPKTNESTSSKSSALSNGLNKANQIKNVFDNFNNEQSLGENVKNIAKEETKTIVKKKMKEKLVEFFVSVILPILPYIAIVLLIIFFILLIIFAIMGVFDDENNVVDTIKLNYCEYVNLKWGDGLDQNKTITSNEYIKYQINSSEFKRIDDEGALKALVIVYRTNLYANSDNLDSNVCYFDVDEEYEETSNDLLDEIIDETDNKVFSVSKTVLSEIKIDDHFTYTSAKEDKYRLYQDKFSYDKSWVDSNIGSNNISNNTNGIDAHSFSPFAAWYLSKVNNYDYLSLIFHFVTPGSSKGNVYKVVKLFADDGEYGEYANACSDISLTTTPLERQEFIDRVNSNSAVQATFKSNAGKIYDISTNNNFNPEMVVIRAIAEGFSPGGATNNYWGIGCTNNGGGKDCSRYPSFDQGVIGYIQTVKKINSVSLFQMQYKYTYIGAYWYNPGSWSQGGCKYFPYVKKYLSESRASDVEQACAEGKTCSGGSCLKTTDEDQSAYTRYQIESMLQKRANVFGITADDCGEEDAEHEDAPASSLGEAVVKYAIKTFDKWLYSNDNRHQDGYVDCSSLVSRAYRHFNVRIYDSYDTSGEIYRWCEKNGKTVSGSNLAPGDLIFYNSGSHSNSDHYKNIGHVEMYAGNGKKFGAHSQYTGTGKNRKLRPVEDQVSVTSYSGGGNLFCRPVSK